MSQLLGKLVHYCISVSHTCSLVAWPPQQIHLQLGSILTWNLTGIPGCRFLYCSFTHDGTRTRKSLGVLRCLDCWNNLPVRILRKNSSQTVSGLIGPRAYFFHRIIRSDRLVDWTRFASMKLSTWLGHIQRSLKKFGKLLHASISKRQKIFKSLL